LIDLQKWAEGLLNDQKPLEVLYEKHPETKEDVMVIKVHEAIIIAKSKLSTRDAIAVIGTMANEQWEKHENESTGVQRESDDGVVGD
jgi:hypothetical protein